MEPSRHDDRASITPGALLFDAYGTLFDVHSVLQRAGDGIPGNLADLSRLWRQKQLERTWLRALMGRYQGFWTITEAALRSSAGELGIALAEPQVSRLMQAYLSPTIFPDAKPALDGLKDFKLGILSNGSSRMLESAVRANGIESYFAHLISVDRIKTYKPSPAVYALGAEVMQTPASEILFVSSNAWDAAGAKAFGYSVCLCNRSGAAADDLGFTADFCVDRLDQIAANL